MWKREKNHLVWTEPWVFVQLPGQEIVYMQLELEEKVHTKRRLRIRDVLRFARWISQVKSLAIL